MKTPALVLSAALLFAGVANAGSSPTTPGAAGGSAGASAPTHEPMVGKQDAVKCKAEARAKKLEGKVRDKFVKDCEAGKPAI